MNERWAEELAAIAGAGNAHPSTPYDAARYARIAVLAEELRAAAAEQGGEGGGIGSADREALEAHTAIMAAEAAVFDSEGRILLIQRTDSRLWALPGGAADVGDLPAIVAERETWEETGLRVRAELLIGLYCRPPRTGRGRGLGVLVFLCRYEDGVPVVTYETLDVGYFAATTLPPLHGDCDRRVADAFAARAAGGGWEAVCI